LAKFTLGDPAAKSRAIFPEPPGECQALPGAGRVIRIPDGPGSRAGMQRDFWLERWARNEIGFHLSEVNPRLQRFWPLLHLPASASVFVPLCGKSLDLHWLAAQGHRVIGVELAEAAVQAFFAEAGLASHVDHAGSLPRRSAAGIDIYSGDVFELRADELANVGGVFDRAALVALPPPMRERYAAHVLRIVPAGTRILLLTFEYDQTRIPGPPHAVMEDEVMALYGARSEVELLAREPVRVIPPSFAAAGVTDAAEAVYRIVKRS
jgi:thiopurine S-methyltransferase